MVSRTFEAILRRPVQLLLLLLVPVIIGLAIGYTQPRSYQVNASIWALHRYEVIGSTGPESNLQATPAETQATALSELLKTRSVAVAIGRDANVISTLTVGNQSQDDAIYNEISKHITVTPNGYNLFSVSYTSKDKQVAKRVLDKTIEQYSIESLAFSKAEGQHLLATYHDELSQAKQNTTAAVQAEVDYLTKHPHASLADQEADPQYDQLHAQTQAAQTREEDIQNRIDVLNRSISSQGENADTLFKVVDQPKVPDVALSRTKELLTEGGIGLGIGVLASILLIVFSVRRDHTMHTRSELQKATPFPIITETPRFSSDIVTLLTQYS